MKNEFVFINASGDTFTPTMSGSLGPWIWEVCQAAKVDGILPVVISKRQPKAPPFDWPRIILVDWPEIRQNWVAQFAYRAHRKLAGWAEFGQRTFASRVGDAIALEGLSDSTFFLQNDPEIAVYLRGRFPEAFIICHFQNQQECRPRFRTALAASVDRVTACSEFTAMWIEHYYGLHKGQAIAVHSGVDSQKFSPVPSPPGPPVINFTGRTGIEKAPDLFLAAAIKLSARTRDFSIQMLGASVSGWQEWNPFQKALKAQAEELEALGIEVRWPGHIDRYHIVDEMRKAQIHVTPSRWDEPFGLVTLEAMSCGLATIASRTGGTPEVVGDGGILFDRDNVDDLVKCLEPLVLSAATRNKWATRARGRAETMTWARTWTAIRDITSNDQKRRACLGKERGCNPVGRSWGVKAKSLQ